MDSPLSLKFGRFELLGGTRQLLQDGAPVVLGSRAFDVLMALAERRERVVTKTELIDRVWPGLVVEENNLQVQISTLRKLLGPQSIATVPGRGYRFTAALDAMPGDGPAPGAASASVRAGSRTSSTAGLTNLPPEVLPLYGRDGDLHLLRPLVAGHKLVTVVGAGGIGKSRLAQALAHQMTSAWIDGAWMVELAGLSNPELLPSVVAQVLGVSLPGTSDALAELVAGLAQRTLLLVLDNCEHLLDTAALLAQAVLAGAHGVTLLVTSQEPLRLPIEQQYRLVPLAVPHDATVHATQDYGSLALFEARVRAIDPHFTLGAKNTSLAIDICRRLDGLPLAIELAAARVTAIGLSTVRDKLDARFKLLTGGARASLRRHQTLRAALEWSHNLLSEPERAVFRRLGVFAGGFTMQLAQSVAADAQLDEWAVLEHLGALVDKSLVVVEAGETPRYRLLESARAFALEQLAETETAQTLHRHAVELCGLLERVDAANIDCELRSDEFAALILPELDNLRAARAWSQSDDGDTHVAAALAAYASSLIDYAHECIEWVLPLRPQFESGRFEPALAARYWSAIAATNLAGHLPRSVQQEAAVRAVELYRTQGKPRRVFSNLINLSRHLRALNQGEASTAALDEARSLIGADWPPEFHYRLRLRDASAAQNAGRLEEALDQMRDVVRLGASMGDWRLEAIARSNLSDLLWVMGRHEEAARVAGALAAEFRHKPAANGDMALLLGNLIGILSEMNRIAQALEVAREALPIMRRARYADIDHWVHLIWRCRRLEAAATLLGAIDAERLRMGTPLQVNEQRLNDQVRADLVARLEPQVLALHLARGAAMREVEWLPLVSQALPHEPAPDR